MTSVSSNAVSSHTAALADRMQFASWVNHHRAALVRLVDLGDELADGWLDPGYAIVRATMLLESCGIIAAITPSTPDDGTADLCSLILSRRQQGAVALLSSLLGHAISARSGDVLAIGHDVLEGYQRDFEALSFVWERILNLLPLLVQASELYGPHHGPQTRQAA